MHEFTYKIFHRGWNYPLDENSGITRISKGQEGLCVIINTFRYIIIFIYFCLCVIQLGKPLKNIISDELDEYIIQTVRKQWVILIFSISKFYSLLEISVVYYIIMYYDVNCAVKMS